MLYVDGCHRGLKRWSLSTQCWAWALEQASIPRGPSRGLVNRSLKNMIEWLRVGLVLYFENLKMKPEENNQTWGPWALEVKTNAVHGGAKKNGSSSPCPWSKEKIVYVFYLCFFTMRFIVMWWPLWSLSSEHQPSIKRQCMSAWNILITKRPASGWFYRCDS